MQTIEFLVPGMTCSHCVAAVTEELQRVDGVTSVAIDLPSKSVVVVGDRLDRAQLWAAVDEAGYEATD